MEHYDYIIAGGGCAGISVAYQLIHSPLRHKSILIIDRDDKDQNDRTWAFWTDRPTPFQHIVEHEWRQLRVTAGSGLVTSTGSWRYLMIRGDKFYRHTRALLDAAPNVRWIKAPVKRIEDGVDGATVWLDPDGRGPSPAIAYHGSWVFDSLFNIADFKPDTRHHVYLEQHFKGWFVETASDAFDPDCATLFDFRTPQSGEMRFFYVLPTSPREALVEYVGLHLADFDQLLDTYIRKTLGIEKYRVVGDEIGITPLTDAPFARQGGAHIRRVGIPGGAVKPSSGYAYTRIQDDSTAILHSLLEHGHPFEYQRPRMAYAWLDRVMLEAMRVEPEAFEHIFGSLFQNNPAPRIFRFLDEQATAGDMLALVASLPKGPFIRAVGRLGWSRVPLIGTCGGGFEQASTARAVRPSASHEQA